MMLETAALVLKTDKPVKEPAIKLRGYIGDKFSDYSLLHHHMDGGNLYTYPKVQYKVIEGTPIILGIEEGAKVLKEISNEIKKLELGNSVYVISGRQINEQDVDVVADRNTYRYQFITPWLALNQTNYSRFEEMRDWREKKLFLNSILIGNILSMCKGLGIIVNKELYVHTRIEEQKTSYKNIPLMGFTGEFTVNFKIPDFFGIGKGVSSGNGVVRNLGLKYNEGSIIKR